MGCGCFTFVSNSLLTDNLFVNKLLATSRSRPRLFMANTLLKPAVSLPSQAAEQAALMLKTLSNPDRLLLLCHMTEGERCVGDLEALTGIAQPTLSQQLTVLRRQGLVSTRRDGKHIHYRLTHPSALAILQLLHRLYCSDSAQQPTPTDTPNEATP